MGITISDIAAQRAMLARGEQIRLRDTFAAAALSGIMASDDRGDAVARSWKLADAMLRERNGAVDSRETVRLTDDEREAIEASMHVDNDATVIATLRNLLERTK